MRTVRKKALAYSALIGMACILTSWCIIFSLSKHGITMQLVSTGDGKRVALRFTNLDNNDVVLDGGRMEYFLVPPIDDSGHYILHVRNKPLSIEQSALALSASNRIAVKPGEWADVGDIMPLLRNMPPGKATVTAIFSVPASSPRAPGSWHGFLRSPPFSLEVS